MRRGMRLALVAGLILTVGLGGAAPIARAANARSAKPAAAGATSLEALRAGRVVVSESSRAASEGGMRAVTAQMVINRPLTAVWQALMNQEGIFQNEPHMKKVSTLSKTPQGRQDVAYSLSISSLLPTFNYVTRIHFVQDAWTANFNRISGSFRAFRGSARLTPLDGGDKTLMTYALEVDPGFLIPQFVVRNILRSELPSLMNHIRAQVSSRSAVAPARR